VQPFTPRSDKRPDYFKLGINQGFMLIPTPYQQRPLKQRRLTLGYFSLTPVGGGFEIDFEYQVIVVAHHRIGAHPDGKLALQLTKPVDNPLAPVLIAIARMCILSTQEGTRTQRLTTW